MGKWGGYHTEFAHLARGFAGNDRSSAEAVGEALLDAGLLARSRASASATCSSTRAAPADIHALIERGEAPGDLKLPQR